MSYTSSSAAATCSITGLDDTRTAALAVYDYLVNHHDEIPESLDELDSDDVAHEIECYLAIESPGTLTIAYSTESDSANCSAEVFDFLTDHFACLQTSPYMEVTWVTFDSRDGAFSGTNYYDQSNKRVDIKALLTAHLAPATAGE
jgi:hypothetical protein